MTLEEMKAKKAELESNLKMISGKNKIAKMCREELKKQIEKLEIAIFKTEAPETFENWRTALQGYIENTHY